jgi:hypothetical protein
MGSNRRLECRSGEDRALRLITRNKESDDSVYDSGLTSEKKSRLQIIMRNFLHSGETREWEKLITVTCGILSPRKI